jgi:hypothetical protein
MITDDIQVDEKGVAKITIPFDSAPKIYISSNYPVLGASESSKDRMVEYELHNYFSSEHKPSDEFGRMFFGLDWPIEEWARFDDYMTRCLQAYLKNGIIEQSPVNRERRKIIQATSEDFFEWAENYLSPVVVEKKEWDAVQKNITRTWNEDHGFTAKSTNQAKKWLQAYATYKNWEYTTPKIQGTMHVRIKYLPPVPF